MGGHQHHREPRSTNQLARIIHQLDGPNMQPPAPMLEHGRTMHPTAAHPPNVVCIDLDAHSVHALLGCEVM